MLDGFGLAVFMPLLDIVANNREIIDESKTPIHELINTLGISTNLSNILILMVFVFTFKGLMKFISSFYQVNIFQSFIKNTRIKIISSFNKINFKYFSTTDIGRVQNTLTTEVDRVSNACRVYLKGIESLSLIITYLILAFLSNTKFTLLVILGSILTNFIYKKINNNTKKQSSILVERNSFYQGIVIQYVGMFKYFKVSGRIKVFANKIKSQILNVEATNKKIGILNSISLSIREPLMIIILASVMFIQISILRGSLELILLSILFFYRALQTVLKFQNQYNIFLSLQGSIINVKDFQKELLINKENNGKIKFTKFKESVRLKNINFSYNNNTILSDISLEIKKNETIAFIGESGSGKSTLMNVLAGLIPIDSGEFTIDGEDLSNIDKISYQKNIGYITQESVIFNDTLFNNVTFFDEKNKENLKKFFEAIKKSCLLEFVNKSYLKEDSILGSNGINLSGGQKQRISIARELYKNTDLLFLDEATSALDSATENFIQNNIEKIKGTKTMVISAHRLSTVKKADRIVILEKGKIISVGSFNNLIDNDENFKRMIDLQEF